MPGEDWNAGDEFDVEKPTAGLEIVWHKGRRWAFVEGNGYGISTGYRMFALDVSHHGTRVRVIYEPKSGDLCRLVTQYVNL
jgi:hypothetical protein